MNKENVRANEEREYKEALQFYGITDINASLEEIEEHVYSGLVIPTYEEFKTYLFDRIKEIGVRDTKDHIEEVFDTYNEETVLLFPSNIFSQIDSLIDDWLYDAVYEAIESKNKLNALRMKNPCFDIYEIKDNMPSELYCNDPETVSEQYWEKLEKEDLNELKDVFLSLAREE